MPLSANLSGSNDRAADPANYARALLNVLEDFAEEKTQLLGLQNAILNVLEDSHFESEHLRAIHSAMLNILDDADADKKQLLATERAVVNILGDAERDKERLNLTQKSMLNILDDFGTERDQLRLVQRASLNILEDFDEERKMRAVAELRLRYMNQHLEETVSVRTSQLVESNKQREALIREVYHRVKNNLQVVDSLLSMQEKRLNDSESKQALSTLRGRIQTFGLVHEQLMNSDDLVTFDIAPFLNQLCRNVLSSGANSAVALSVDVMPWMVTLDFAIPLGLVATELVTNCIKHAFWQGNDRISVTLKRNSKTEVAFIVSDNGGGPVFPAARNEGLGMKIIRGLVGQLDGVMKISRNDGYRTEILLATKVPL
jgi:two-component sensor histidine kinase